MSTTTAPVSFIIDGEGVANALREIRDKIVGDGGQVLLDFSAVRRIDAGALKSLELVARVADEKAVKVVICGANVEVYKVLKLARLASRFQFVD